jgi:hypothetical protein
VLTLPYFDRCSLIGLVRKQSFSSVPQHSSLTSVLFYSLHHMVVINMKFQTGFTSSYLLVNTYRLELIVESMKSQTFMLGLGFVILIFLMLRHWARGLQSCILSKVVPWYQTVKAVPSHQKLNRALISGQDSFWPRESAILGPREEGCWFLRNRESHAK